MAVLIKNLIWEWGSHIVKRIGIDGATRLLRETDWNRACDSPLAGNGLDSQGRPSRRGNRLAMTGTPSPSRETDRNRRAVSPLTETDRNRGAVSPLGRNGGESRGTVHPLAAKILEAQGLLAY